MNEMLKGIGALIAILVALGGLFNAFFSTFSYDSFDIKLMPRNKSSIVRIKKTISTFIIVIPLFIFAAYVNAFAFYSYKFMVTLLYSLLLILMLVYIISFILSGLEWLLKKLLNQKLINGAIQAIVKKVDYLFRVNIKLKDYVVLLLLFVLLTIMAGHHLTNIPSSPYLEIQNLIEAVKVLMTMSMLILVLLVPIFIRKKSVEEYTYLIDIITVQDLINELGDEYPLNLDYFLNETVSVFSSKNRVYKVIKRLNVDTIQYEVYKKSKRWNMNQV
ncbi:hypothetical protein M9R32_07970 [Paenisporosarcina quisquiliarum]|uniref:Uncharacterized protein n=1 Tax=Paenisporosarcina quisquiliarum TaxID=365346 RepID=A0A9X3LHG5_9BACL|nr:hypothetical protein [Paenisporosarcina quisquiliarum]MCZ8537111.1 hypothetical protein [Paenisporosarcina quisquiliarum]